MTVLVNPSADTMTVNRADNIVSPADSQHSNDTNNAINDILSEDNSGNGPDVNISDPNWSTNNCIINNNTDTDNANNANSSSNDNNDNSSNNTINNSSVSPAEEPVNPDDALEPIDRLEKYSCSDIIFHRLVSTITLSSLCIEIKQFI